MVLVAERTPERVRPLEDVRAQVESAVRAQNRQKAQDDWLASLRDQIEVHDFLILDVDDAAEEAPFTVPAPQAEGAGDGAGEAAEQQGGDAADQQGEDGAAPQGEDGGAAQTDDQGAGQGDEPPAEEPAEGQAE